MKGLGPGRLQAPSTCLGLVLGLLLTGAALVAAGGWALRKLGEEMTRYRGYRELQRHAGTADSLRSVYAAAERDLAALTRALPIQNRASHVLSVLVEEAKRGKLALSGITALDERVFPAFTEVPFELAVQGEFPVLVAYLHSLETRGMAVQVRNVQVRSEDLHRSRIHARLDLSVLAPAGTRP